MLICIACGQRIFKILFTAKVDLNMLNKSIKISIKSKGLLHDELAIKLNVMRQTALNQERGLSAPDSEKLISLLETLEIDVSTLLGENIEESKTNDLEG